MTPSKLFSALTSDKHAETKSKINCQLQPAALKHIMSGSKSMLQFITVLFLGGSVCGVFIGHSYTIMRLPASKKFAAVVEGPAEGLISRFDIRRNVVYLKLHLAHVSPRKIVCKVKSTAHSDERKHRRKNDAHCSLSSF